jgi:eukaryotic-like serine/threonine-protein kinase
MITFSGVSRHQAAARPISPGQIVAGKYRVEAVLGQGGMAVVVAAVHAELDQRVAIKMLLPELEGDDQLVARFLREAKAAVKIRGEHVGRVLDVGRLDHGAHGAPYMVLEYLDGIDLGAWVDRHGRMPVMEAVDVIVQACDALAQAHALGIVHRDIKPSNLFVTTRDNGTRCVKVIDFGISKLMPTEAEPSMTATTEVFGSPQYMSPEQVRASRNVDARADVWALGAVLYELLTGKPLFRAESIMALGAAILNEAPSPLSEHRTDVPPAVEAAMLRCIEKKREARFSSVVDLSLALAPFASPACSALIAGMERAAALPPYAEGESHSAIRSRIPPAGPVTTDPSFVNAPTVIDTGRVRAKRALVWMTFAAAVGALSLFVWWVRHVPRTAASIPVPPTAMTSATPEAPLAPPTVTVATTPAIPAVPAIPAPPIASVVPKSTTNPIVKPRPAPTSATTAAPIASPTATPPVPVAPKPTSAATTVRDRHGGD